MPRRVPWLLALLWSVLPGPATNTAAAAPAPPPSPHPGRALAQKYCVSCHLFPEPDSLPRAAWRREIEPAMARWLGRKPVDYATLPEGMLLKQAAPYPDTPLVPDEDWERLWDYYERTAPETFPPAQPAVPAPSPLRQFRVRKLNPGGGGAPMTSLVKIEAARRRLLVGDAFAGLLYALGPGGDVQDKLRLGSAPVAASAGRAQTFLTLIGRVFPSDAPAGSVVHLAGRRDGVGQARPVLAGLRRPTDTVVADLNQDGREDLFVCSFGNVLGRVGWFENRGDGHYEEHVLIERAGALRAEVLDMTGDGRPDVLVMMAQAREGLWLWVNEGDGRFRMETLLEWPPTWGGADFALADFNRDGRVDVLTVHGDNGDFRLPPKPYHGLRVYLNEGGRHFREAHFHPLPGAYRARVRDFDGDGDPDIAAVAFYPDFNQTPAGGFVYLENLGGLRFRPMTLPDAGSGRWITLDAGDLDGDGDEDLALGSFVQGPETVPVPAAVKEQWRTNGAAVLLLENVRKP